jgi:sirohydrochlorin cobaltochelatase
MRKTSFMTWLTRCTLVLLAAVAAGCATPPAPTAAVPDNTFGVLVMAHGGSKQWNDTVLAAVEPLRERYKLDVAFGMADAASLQTSVSKLETQGVRRIAVVRLFVSGESWYERTQQILGIAPGAPARPPAAANAHAGHEGNPHAGHSMEFWRIDTQSTFVMSKEGLADAAEMDAILAERVHRLSRDPKSEDVLLLAHGPGDDAENVRWIEKITARTAALRAAQPFRRVEVHTLREDWPDKRQAAEQGVREFVRRAASDNGRAIVIPFRVEGFGPYAKVLSDLEYVSDGVGLLPHPNVTKWIERQVVTLR